MVTDQTTPKTQLSTKVDTTSPVELAAAKCLHCNPHSKGGLGKSFHVETHVSWLDRYGFGWRGYDLDDRHRTFAGRHPDEVKCFELGNAVEAKNVFLRLLRGVLRSTAPIHVLDLRAQADFLFMNALEQLNFLELCREAKVRVTFFLFTADDLESMENFRNLVLFGGKNVNYVVVKNPVKTQSRLFDGSPLERKLLGMGAKIIELPSISPATMLAMERVEGKIGRNISFAEFASSEARHLEPIMIAEMQWALTHAYMQYDAIADLLLPSDLVAKVQTARVGSVSKKKVLSTDDGFGFQFDDSEDD